MAYAPKYQFDAMGEHWGLIHDRAGEFLVLGKLEEGSWRYRSVTVETHKYERGEETLLELLKKFFQMVFDDFKKEYPDNPEELKTFQDKIDYALTYAIKAFNPIKGTFELDETELPE